jgi:hypothetical protein
MTTNEYFNNIGKAISTKARRGKCSKRGSEGRVVIAYVEGGR